MVYQAYGSLSEKDKEQPWLSVNGLCRIMKCSTSGYYEWKRKYEDPVPSEKTRSDKKIKEKMLRSSKSSDMCRGRGHFAANCGEDMTRWSAVND